MFSNLIFKDTQKRNTKKTELKHKLLKHKEKNLKSSWGEEWGSGDGITLHKMEQG